MASIIQVGRPKEFDVDQTLAAAMRLFWERGYEATSMSDLVERLGVSRQSLYDTFGDKHSVYLAALTRFGDEQREVMAALLDGDAPIRALVRRALASVIDVDLAGGCPRGCMMTNAAVELGEGDPEVAALFRENARAVELLWSERLRQARDAGEIASHHDPLALARFFIGVLSGLRVTAKAQRERRVLEDIAETAVRVLG